MEGFVIQPYDMLMLAVLVGMTIFGAYKGMAWQVAAISSVVVSCFMAVKFGGLLAPHIGAQPPWDYCIAMLILYVSTSLAIWMFFRVIAGIIDRVKLKDFDRQMGALFGLTRGVLYCLVITFFAVTLSESSRQAVLKSRSGYYTAVLIHRAAPVLPDQLRDVLGKHIDELHRKLHPDHPAEEGVAGEAGPSAIQPKTTGQPDVDVAGERRPRAWEADRWREDGQAVLDERIDELSRRAGDELGRLAGDELNRRLEESTEAAHRAVSRRLEEFGSRIERRPLVPVQP